VRKKSGASVALAARARDLTAEELAIMVGSRRRAAMVAVVRLLGGTRLRWVGPQRLALVRDAAFTSSGGGLSALELDVLRTVARLAPVDLRDVVADVAHGPAARRLVERLLDEGLLLRRRRATSLLRPALSAAGADAVRAARARDPVPSSQIAPERAVALWGPRALWGVDPRLAERCGVSRRGKNAAAAAERTWRLSGGDSATGTVEGRTL
jgi:hypothetical protein